MSGFAAGMLYTLGLLAAFAAGLLAGWNARKRAFGQNLPTAVPISGQDAESVREAEAAFRAVMNYSVEDAYGMRDDLSTGTGSTWTGQ